MIFQPGLLAAPILKITLKNIYEQPGEGLSASLSVEVMPFSFQPAPCSGTFLITSVGPGSGIALGLGYKLLGALSDIFPLALEL